MPKTAQKVDEREFARILYIGSAYTLKFVAETVKVSEQTIGRWAAEEEWGKQREMRQGSIYEMDSWLMGQLNKWRAIGESRPLKYSEALTVRTLIDSRRILLGENTVAAKSAAVDELLRYVQANAPEIAAALAKQAQGYLHDLGLKHHVAAR